MSQFFLCNFKAYFLPNTQLLLEVSLSPLVDVRWPIFDGLQGHKRKHLKTKYYA